MNESPFSRRKLLKNLSLAAGASLLPATAFSANESLNAKRPKPAGGFRYCLNTSTIRTQKLGLVAEIELAAKTGYDAIEIWINTLQQYIDEGKSLSDLRKRIDDLGIEIADAIGFAPWIVDNNDQRSAGLEQAKREMGLLAQIGCKRIAAPPAGATQYPGLDLMKAAERYRALLDLGQEMGVMPQLEVWGFSQNLSRLSEVLFVMAECGHPGARILPDVYHLFKGGSDFDGLKLISGRTIEIFHVNDYPAEPARETMNDSHRVYPGDGIAPLGQILQDLHWPDSPTILSLELFNRDYWQQDAALVARTGLEKMKAAVAKAIG